ncbi:MAG: hypothetical protein SOY07_09015 [Bacteroidales bacterium]|nr:hypothetical protein [Bacteroidales bacterium]
MAQRFNITVSAAATAEQAQKIGARLQGVLDKVKPEDVIKLLTKVDKDPGIVKTALKFI